MLNRFRSPAQNLPVHATIPLAQRFFCARDAWCRDINGIPLPISKEQVEQAKSFRVSVERRNCRGATAPSEVARMLEQQGGEARALLKCLDTRRARWAAADRKLHKTAQELAAQA